MMMTFIGWEPSCPAPRGQPPAHRRSRVFHNAGPPRNPAPLEGRRQARREPALPSRPLAAKLRAGDVLPRGAHRLAHRDLVVVAHSASLVARQIHAFPGTVPARTHPRLTPPPPAPPSLCRP